MKSERRHKLERNELADRLGTGVAVVQPVLPFILGALAILAVGSIAWGVYSTGAKKQEATAWTDYYFNLTGGDADDFMDVADLFPKSTASGWARQTAGDSYLAQGIDALYRNRAEGETKIQQAIDAFEDILNGAPGDSLRTKALIGLGEAHESLGDLDKAIGYYQQVLTTPAPPRLLSSISERLSFLQSESGKTFYKWFTALDPKPDEAIDLRDLNVPPTLQSGGLEFSDPANGLGESAPLVPDLDLKGLGLPQIETPADPSAATLDELKLPEQPGTSAEQTNPSEESKAPAKSESTSAAAESQAPSAEGR